MKSNVVRGLPAALAIFALPFVAGAQYAGAEPVPERYRAGFDAITVEDAKSWLGFLAGPETLGRGTGQDGYQRAAEFMAEQFARYGLKPAGDNGTFFQNIKFERSRAVPGSMSMSVEGANARADGSNLVITGLTEDLDLTGPLVVIRADARNARLDDGTAVRGSVVMLLGAGASTLRQRLGTMGPAAVVTVGRVWEPEWQAQRAGGQRPARRTPQVVLSQEGAQRLLGAVGSTELLKTEAPETPILRSHGNVTLRAKFVREEVDVPNVVAILEGSDPNLKHEVVGFSAHLDHLGAVNGEVYWGADDDGSGSTALIHVAKAFHTNPVKPRRSLMFFAFAAEEMGLVGSRYFVDNPTRPIEHFAALMNMDMVGRNFEAAEDKPEDNVQTICLVGSKRISTELHDAVIHANRFVNFTFRYDQEGVYTRSDHYSFARVGIPIAFLFSGFHPDYHRPTDTIDKINFEKLTNAAKLFYLTGMDVANRDQKVKRDVGGGGS
jgi:hypothetical protein